MTDEGACKGESITGIGGGDADSRNRSRRDTISLLTERDRGTLWESLASSAIVVFSFGCGCCCWGVTASVTTAEEESLCILVSGTCCCWSSLLFLGWVAPGCVVRLTTGGVVVKGGSFDDSGSLKVTLSWLESLLSPTDLVGSFWSSSRWIDKKSRTIDDWLTTGSNKHCCR